jgi:hypothetical protein
VPTFQFYLADFKITDTRSHHNDTLIAGLGVAVNGAIAGIQVAQMGDFNNGTYQFWEHKLDAVNNAVINPNDEVSFVFQMYNNGHNHKPNQAMLTEAIVKDLSTLQAQINGAHGSSGNPGDFPSPDYSDASGAAFFTGGLYEMFKAIFGNCDGIVVGYGQSLMGSQLEASVNAGPGGVLKNSNIFNATTNGYGKPCNSSGSNYIVTWIVQHQP